MYECSGPPGLKSQSFLRVCKNVLENDPKVKIAPQTSENEYFLPFWDTFGGLLAPTSLFSDFFLISGLAGPETPPVNGSSKFALKRFRALASCQLRSLPSGEVLECQPSFCDWGIHSEESAVQNLEGSRSCLTSSSRDASSIHVLFICRELRTNSKSELLWHGNKGRVGVTPSSRTELDPDSLFGDDASQNIRKRRNTSESVTKSIRRCSKIWMSPSGHPLRIEPVPIWMWREKYTMNSSPGSDNSIEKGLSSGMSNGLSSGMSKGVVEWGV